MIPPVSRLISKGECCDACNAYIDRGDIFYRWNLTKPKLTLCEECQDEARRAPVVDKTKEQK